MQFWCSVEQWATVYSGTCGIFWPNVALDGKIWRYNSTCAITHYWKRRLHQPSMQLSISCIRVFGEGTIKSNFAAQSMQFWCSVEQWATVYSGTCGIFWPNVALDGKIWRYNSTCAITHYWKRRLHQPSMQLSISCIRAPVYLTVHFGESTFS